jgi:uncharacterized phage protein (TIGR01671 family)
MMREILFRGKSKSTGKWVYGYLVEGNDWNTNEPITAIIETDAVFYPRNEIVSYEVVNPETVGQWSGRVDKNGVKIFDGDIVRAMMDFGPGGFCERTVHVGFITRLGSYQWEYFDMSTIEVIGSDYDRI